MFTVSLDLVRPSPNPIRKTWDEDKMQELAASIKERGVIVPIKVRPVEGVEPCHIHGWYGVDGEGSAYDRATGYGCEGCTAVAAFDDEGEEIETWEIVYGHRRVEAARRAGLTEIPAIVEGVEDDDAQIEGLIENVQREDMNPVEIGQALYELQLRSGWTSQQLSEHTTIPVPSIYRYLQLVKLPDDIKSNIGTSSGPVKSDPLTIRHIDAVKVVNHGDKRAEILRKAVSEDLTHSETRRVAEAYNAAETPELKEAVLQVSGKSQFIEDAANRLVYGDEVAEQRRERELQQVRDYGNLVKSFLTALSGFNDLIDSTETAASDGKFSPEGAQFALRRVEKTIARLEALRQVLKAIK